MKLIAEHRLRNDAAESRHLGTWVKAFAEAAKLSPAASHAFDLALVEWVTNVISYAFDDGCEHWIVVRLMADRDRACAQVEDDGREFNPLDRPPVDTSAPLEQRSGGGLGIHMVRRLMDSVEYRRQDGRNILTLTRLKT